jgi:hypothetical protein
VPAPTSRCGGAPQGHRHRVDAEPINDLVQAGGDIAIKLDPIDIRAQSRAQSSQRFCGDPQPHDRSDRVVDRAHHASLGAPARALRVARQRPDRTPLIVAPLGTGDARTSGIGPGQGGPACPYTCLRSSSRTHTRRLLGTTRNTPAPG